MADGVLEEVQSLFADVGVDARWFTGDPRSDVSDVITVRVLLRPRSSEQLGLAPNAMGANLASERRGEAVFVFLPNVLRTVGHEGNLELGTSPQQRSRIQRALARVIAHEVIHAVLPERVHDADGIFSARLTRRRLVSKELDVDSETAAALSRRLRQSPASAGSTTAVIASQCET